MAEGKSLLDLSITFNRNTITIDGTDYEIRHPDEFNLRTSALLDDRCKKIVKAFTEEISEESAVELEGFVSEVLGKVFIEIPDEVGAAINMENSVKIIEAFFTQFPQVAAKLAEAKAPKTLSPKIGGKRSQSSNASMVATPSGG